MLSTRTQDGVIDGESEDGECDEVMHARLSESGGQ